MKKFEKQEHKPQTESKCQFLYSIDKPYNSQNKRFIHYKQSYLHGNFKVREYNNDKKDLIASTAVVPYFRLRFIYTYLLKPFHITPIWN